MRKFLISTAVGSLFFVSLWFVMGEGKEISTDANASSNSDKNNGVSTGMNGNTSSNLGGVSISSTQSSSESRSVTGHN